MREIEIFEEYVNGKVNYLNPNDQPIAEEIISELHKTVQINDMDLKFDSLPDMLLEYNEKILIIEHFDIDASTFTSGKGNENRIQESKRNKKWSQEIKNINKENVDVQVTYDVNCEYNLKNYLSNLERSFCKHYSKIDNYKNALINSGIAKAKNDIKVAFLIIDQTVLGCHYIKDGKMNPLSIFQVREFYNLLMNSPELDFVFNGICIGSSNEMYFLSNSDDSRKLVKSMIVDFQEVEFTTFQPKEIRVCLFFPKNKPNQ